jgi:hypothetical protein
MIVPMTASTLNIAAAIRWFLNLFILPLLFLHGLRELSAIFI